MSDATLTLRRVTDDGGLASVERLLSANDLPTDDVRSSPPRFYAGHDGSERVAVGGLEVYGRTGLLRSVVVERSARGEGFGAAMCEALEDEARAAGVETLYLLTTTAAEFFADRGYVECSRPDAPESIRTTVEFDELCPATATCMWKPL